VIVDCRSRCSMERGPGSSSQSLIRSIQLVVQAYGFDLSTPFEKFPDKIQNLLLYGEPQRGAARE